VVVAILSLCCDGNGEAVEGVQPAITVARKKRNKMGTEISELADLVKTNPPFQTREAPPFPAIPYRPASIDILQENRLGEKFLDVIVSCLLYNQQHLALTVR
jgi:hypothetical protein